MTLYYTGTTCTTYNANRPCPRLDWDDKPDQRTCLLAPLEHYGQPTGDLFCYTHFYVVGTVTP